MKINLAGAYNGKITTAKNFTDEQYLDKCDILMNYPYMLESYHYLDARRTQEIRDDKRIVFLDSGAFSAFTQGSVIDLDKYCSFIENNKDIINYASVLDGIGDPELTLNNQTKMEDLGASPLPCFHYGEPIEYLQHYVDNYGYITLGGMVPISTSPLREWLDDIWSEFLTDANGLPKVKVHGFGLTSLQLMDRYPWYSVDSTSWVMTGAFGSIYFPTDSNINAKLSISDRSPKNKNFGGHYASLSSTEKLACDKRFEEWGFRAEDLARHCFFRDLWNIKFFHSLCDKPIKPFFREQQGLFG